MRNKRPHAPNQRGFTLIEIFVIVIILIVLGAVGYPRYVELMVKARQSEAKNNLAFLYSLESAYFKSHNTYAAMQPLTPENCNAHPNKLGFAPSDCTNGRYSYWVDLNGREDFTGHAQSVVPLWTGCEHKDHWTVDERKSITAKNDVTAGPKACQF